MSTFNNSSIGNVMLRNSFIRSGTWMRKATEDGELTPELIAEYTKLAKGNLGMVIAGYARVDSEERANNCQIGMFDDKFIPSLREFTNIFHQNGTAIGIQLAMGGTQVHYQGDVTWELLSPSARTITQKNQDGIEEQIAVPEMTKEQIKDVIGKFARAAVRVQESGFDMVQIHAGHGYFISQWMNPELNTRTDEYGQDRSLFITELYEAMRLAVGDEFAIGIKLNSEEKINDDSNHQQILDLCQKLDKAGIDLIEVSGFAPSRNRIKSIEDESYFKSFASKLTKVVNCRTMLTGGNKTLSNIEQVKDETGVDFVGLSRPLVSEPDLVTKWINDKNYKSRCISCNHCHRDVYTCVFDK